jgi:hypothetical protein
LIADDKYVDDYYARREWMLRISSGFIPSALLRSFSRECFSIVSLKNRLQRYVILRNRKQYGRAMESIEAELDYCQVSLTSLLTNEYAVDLRLAQQGKERGIADARIAVYRARSGG